MRGFESMRAWLCGSFDKYLDITKEVRRILEPSPDDKLFRYRAFFLITKMSVYASILRVNN